ncbi:hypothetical protein ACVGAV_005634 [Pseudomonas aeruginosa]
MNKANECTCPSGDGSLVHPCPAHPAEQAGGDERAAFELFVRKHCGMPEHIAVNWDAKFTNDAWEGWQARAALAQPSPKREQRLVECDACPTSGGCVEKCMKAPMQPSPAQAEAERPEVVAVVLAKGFGRVCEAIDADTLYQHCSEGEPLMTVTQHSRIVGALRFERQQMDRALTACINERDPLGLAPLAQAFNEAPAEALRPEQAEVFGLERYRVEKTEHGFWPYCVLAGDGTRELFVGHLKQCQRVATELAAAFEDGKFIAQHESIVGGLRAEITQLRQHKNDYMDAGQETYRALQNEIREREAEIARLDCLVSSRTAERDAAQARVAGLEMLLRKLSTNGLMQFSTVDEEMAVQAALGGAPVAQAQHSGPGKYDEVLLPFLKSMEHELHANAGKGDRPGWLQMDRKTALLEIYYHLGKLQKATKGNDTAGIVEYAADVANMSMMLVDVCGLLAAAPGKEVGHE